jgi:hypothetical protein
MFTAEQSVNMLLDVFSLPLATRPATIIQQLEDLIAAPSAEDARPVVSSDPVTPAAA